MTKADVTVAKNYLGQGELGELNRLTGMALDFFEDQTERRRAVTMTALEDKLNEFLKFNSRPVLTHLGSVARPDADAYAEAEYEKFAEARRLRRQEEGKEAIAKLVQLGKEAGKRRRRSA